jgi:hypothetical protein
LYLQYGGALLLGGVLLFKKKPANFPYSNCPKNLTFNLPLINQLLHWLCLQGFFTCSAHKKVMTEKASPYATAIQRSSIWKGEYGLAYNSFYLPSLGYRTPATTLTQQECYNIKKPVVNAILPKMGISRKAHRSVLFGTAQFGGLGL